VDIFLCFGVGKGVARYPLHFDAPQVIFVLGEARLRGGEAPYIGANFVGYQQELSFFNTFLFLFTFFSIYTKHLKTTFAGLKTTFAGS
jgi:hypothetical protein